MRSFDIAFLRSFVAVAEAGTLRGAGERRARSTAAISQQMRALESLAGVELFERARGKVALSDRGHALLPYARELVRLNDEAMQTLQQAGAGVVRFGMPQDFADSSFADALVAFSRLYPAARVEAQVARNSRIAALLEEGALDLALLITRTGMAAGRADAIVPSVWLAREGTRFDAARPLPLVLLEEPCLFREFALESLSRASVPYRVAFTSPSVSGLLAALRAGVGVTARMPIALPEGVAPCPTGTLPVLPPVRLTLRSRFDPGSPAAQALFASVAQALEAMRGPP